jgi:hypothetical protein
LENNVLGLQVAVDDTLRVKVPQARGNVFQQATKQLLLESTAVLGTAQQLTKR